MADNEWRTHRLELDDQTLREWNATVLVSGPDGIVLDRSAFYPGGGGQPPDHGVLLWGGVQTRIVGARKADDLYLIPAENDPLPPPGTSVQGAVEDARRTAHGGAGRRDRVGLVGDQVEVIGLAGAHDAGLHPAPQQHAVVRRLAAAARIEGRTVKHDPVRAGGQHYGVPLAQGLII